MLIIFILFIFLSSTSQFTCSGPGLFPNPDLSKCDTFYQCDTNNNAFLQSCAFPLVYHDATKNCGARTGADCQTMETLCPNSGAQPNPYDCSTYFLCNFGVGTLMPCSTGLLFNPAIGVCDWSFNVQCPDNLCKGCAECTYTSLQPGPSNLACSVSQYWTDRANPNDGSGRSFLYCYGNQLIITYCCGGSHYVPGAYCVT